MPVILCVICVCELSDDLINVILFLQGVELNDLQLVISKLDDPSSPSQVAECLALRRQVMFLKHELVMRYYLKNTFLSSGNMSAFYTLTMCASAALDRLSNTPRLVCYGTSHTFIDCLYFYYRPNIQFPQMILPQPLVAVDEKATVLFPWRTFLAQLS